MSNPTATTSPLEQFWKILWDDGEIGFFRLSSWSAAQIVDMKHVKNAFLVPASEVPPTARGE